MKAFIDFFKKLGSGTKGAIAGFFIAVLLAIFGFWKFLSIVILTIVGYYLGKNVFSDKEVLKNLLDKILPPGRFR